MQLKFKILTGEIKIRKKKKVAKLTDVPSMQDIFSYFYFFLEEAWKCLTNIEKNIICDEKQIIYRERE